MSAHKTGRPSKLTENRADAITALVRNGCPVEAAAAHAGVHRTTVYGWLERGEADAETGQQTPFSDFYDAFTRARGESEAVLVQRVFQAAEKDWRAAMALLERRFPERWVARTEAHVTAQTTTTSRVMVAPDEADDAARIAEVTAVLGQIGVLGEPA